MSLIETGLEKSLENRQGRVISLAEPDGKNASKSTGTSPEAPSGRTGGVCSVLELEEVKNQSFFRSPEPHQKRFRFRLSPSFRQIASSSSLPAGEGWAEARGYKRVRSDGRSCTLFSA